jgi:hypothetical protein
MVGRRFREESVAFDGGSRDQRSAVARRQLPQLVRASGAVRCEGIGRENDRRWRPSIGGEGGFESIAPGGRLQRRGEHTVTSHREGGGGVVLFGQCHAVEGVGKRGAR